MDQKYQEYLGRIHAGSFVNDKLIDEVVLGAVGKVPQSKTKLVVGEINEVYRLDMGGDKNIILRIAQRDDGEFKNESWAVDQARAVGVPVPTIIDIVEVQIEEGKASFCVMEEIVGEALERGNLYFHDLSLQEQQDLLVKSGQILSRIHSVLTRGFGPFLEPGESEYLDSESIVIEYLDKQEQLSLIADAIGLGRNYIEKSIILLDNNKIELCNFEPRLNHGDFGPKHIMVQGFEIVGIIDWGLARSDSPLSDLANWDYWFDDYQLKWLLKGYENKLLLDDTFEVKIYLYRIMKGLDVIEWYYQQGYEKAVEIAVTKLIRDVGYFD